MPRTVHWLDRVITTLRRGREHIVLIVLPVTRLLPQRFIEDLRATHFLITVVAIDRSHVLLNFLPDRPALRVPENKSRRLILHMKEIKLLTKSAMIALLSFFQHMQINVKILFFSPGRTVNTL
ncbi:MAG: hypothetical protein ACD_10C00887G0003 [uncultured bacterium]|nr:MAG: hypothetical protein ACD_10C00887G0003 [uncultured bacterium]